MKSLGISAPVVAERVVTFAHRLPKTNFYGSRHEIEPFLSVSRNSVEQAAQQA
jgi:hypothetical protein